MMDRRTTVLAIIAVIVSLITAVMLPAQVEGAEPEGVKVQVIPYVSHGSNWTYAIDIYNHLDIDTAVTVQYQDGEGIIRQSEDVLIPAYRHEQVSLLDTQWLSDIKTIIIIGNGATMVTAYQMCRDKHGNVFGVAAVPVYEDCGLENQGTPKPDVFK